MPVTIEHFIQTYTQLHAEKTAHPTQFMAKRRNLARLLSSEHHFPDREGEIAAVFLLLILDANVPPTNRQRIQNVYSGYLTRISEMASSSGQGPVPPFSSRQEPMASEPPHRGDLSPAVPQSSADVEIQSPPGPHGSVGVEIENHDVFVVYICQEINVLQGDRLVRNIKCDEVIPVGLTSTVEIHGLAQIIRLVAETMNLTESDYGPLKDIQGADPALRRAHCFDTVLYGSTLGSCRIVGRPGYRRSASEGRHLITTPESTSAEVETNVICTLSVDHSYINFEGNAYRPAIAEIISTPVSTSSTREDPRLVSQCSHIIDALNAISRRSAARLSNVGLQSFDGKSSVQWEEQKEVRSAPLSRAFKNYKLMLNGSVYVGTSVTDLFALVEVNHSHISAAVPGWTAARRLMHRSRPKPYIYLQVTGATDPLVPARCGWPTRSRTPVWPGINKALLSARACEIEEQSYPRTLIFANALGLNINCTTNTVLPGSQTWGGNGCAVRREQALALAAQLTQRRPLCQTLGTLFTGRLVAYTVLHNPTKATSVKNIYCLLPRVNIRTQMTLLLNDLANGGVSWCSNAALMENLYRALCTGFPDPVPIPVYDARIWDEGTPAQYGSVSIIQNYAQVLGDSTYLRPEHLKRTPLNASQLAAGFLLAGIQEAERAPQFQDLRRFWPPEDLSGTLGSITDDSVAWWLNSACALSSEILEWITPRMAPGKDIPKWEFRAEWGNSPLLSQDKGIQMDGLLELTRIFESLPRGEVLHTLYLDNLEDEATRIQSVATAAAAAQLVASRPPPPLPTVPAPVPGVPSPEPRVTLSPQAATASTVPRFPIQRRCAAERCHYGREEQGHQWVQCQNCTRNFHARCAKVPLNHKYFFSRILHRGTEVKIRIGTWVCTCSTRNSA